MRYLLVLPILAIIGSLVWFFIFSPFSPIFRQKISSPASIASELFLEISEPEDSDVVTVQNLKIAGKSRPGRFLAIASSNDSQVLKISDSGEFSANLKLAQGYNLIKFTNFALNGTSVEKTLEVFFLSEKFEELVGSQNFATESGDLQDLTKRLAELRAKKRLKVAAGTVKGILGKNLALETKSGARTVVFEKPAKVGSYPDLVKNLDFGQIQAQDFVVAVGNFAQQGILTAKILLVKPNIAPSFDKVTQFGIVTKLEEESLELTNILDGKTQMFSLEQAEVFGEQGQKIEKKNIGLGNKLLVVGTPKAEKVEAEKILVVSGDFLNELEKFATPPPSTQSATPSAQ